MRCSGRSASRPADKRKRYVHWPHVLRAQGGDVLYVDLEALRGNCESYAAWWLGVDRELYRYFAENTDHGNLRTVYTKVTMVNRLYMTGLERAAHFGPDEKEPARVIAELLHTRRADLDCRLRRISGAEDLTREALADIAALHGWTAQTVLAEARLGSLVSFVSKYLHFHAPTVPIYDQLACAGLAAYIEKRFGRYTATTSRLPRREGQMQYYRWLCSRFVEMWEEVQQLRPGTTVKEMDHHLWVLGAKTRR